MSDLLDWITGTAAGLVRGVASLAQYPALSAGVTAVALVGIAATVYIDARRSR